MDPAPKRPWYQFTLRSLLLVITILCLGPGGYIAYERAKAAKNKAAAEALRDCGGQLEFSQAWHSRSPVLRSFLGDDRYSHIEEINLENFYGTTHVTDADLVHLRRFPFLKRLYIHNVEITDAGVAELAGLTHLETLILSRVKITDESLVHFSDMTRLQGLNLDHTPVKGPGLKHLSGLKDLGYLTLRGTEIEPADIERLQKALPKLNIMR